MRASFPVLRLFAAVSLIGTTVAGGPPKPEGITVVNSTNYPGASISYKETRICETTEGVKAYSGFVNLPPAPAQGRNYELHTWFWFFEARQDAKNAPLSLWFQGGPGAPSTPAAVGEHGPCYVMPNSKDTRINKWSWNDRVNMLYIDQPVQTGFSYDTLISGTINETKTPFNVGKSSVLSTTVIEGIFSSQNSTIAPNSTTAAAAAIWDFMQVWMQDFPVYQPADKKFSIWGESYGGHYCPTFADYFLAQNEKIASGQLSSKTNVPLRLDTVGLVNACIDLETQMPFYPVMAVNNTYGIEVFNASMYTSAVAAVPECLNLTRTCRSMVDRLDPQNWGNNTEVNQACLMAYSYCFTNVARENLQGHLEAGVYHFDIATSEVQSFPPKWAAGYFNTLEVQQALGVPLNWTGNSAAVSAMFTYAGDFVKGNNLAILGQLLDKGVKVALMYGDRDYQCNWFGGEAISLAINSQISTKFQQAGYAKLETNTTYVGGAVRQYGNLSFARVYQAGHEVPYYQPETAYQIFNRVMFDQDVATGKVATVSSKNSTNTSVYATTGSSSALTSGDVAVVFEEKATCYFWDMMETCTPLETAMFGNGSAITKDFVMIGYKLADGTEVLYSQTSGTNTTSTSPPRSTQTGSGASTAKSPASSLLLIVAPLVAVLVALL